MTRFAAYLVLPDGTYRDLELVTEAPNPRAAARRAFELAGIHRDEEFPQVLIVPDDQVYVFGRDDSGAAVTPDEDLPRLIKRGPQTVVLDAYYGVLPDDSGRSTPS